jgi:two-component system chemotaxis sensor kinase CheA
MTIDMSQFYQVFFEETAEHLASMESLLLGLDLDAPDSEELNAIFRAAHSIKGSSGTFGFTDLAEVTHVLENLLDRIRKQELMLRNDMVDAFLEAGDVLKAMLAGHQGGEAVDPGTVAHVCANLKALTSDAAPALASAAHAGAAAVAAATSAAPSGTRYDIEFLPTVEATADHQALPNLLQSLSELGDLDVVTQPGEGAPGLWRLRLRTQSPQADFEDLLEFISENDAWRVKVAAGDAEDAGGAYGLFEAADAGPTEESYGFFEPQDVAVSPAPLVSLAEGDGFGFFEPLPAEAETAAASLATVEEGDGFGFFEPLPAPVAAVPAPVAAAIVADTPTPEVPAVAAAAVKEARAKPAAVAAGGEAASIRVSVDKVGSAHQPGRRTGHHAGHAAAVAVKAGRGVRAPDAAACAARTQYARLQESVMSIRMLPISFVFSRFPRVVRDLSQKAGQAGGAEAVGREHRARQGPDRTHRRSADPPGAQQPRSRHRNAGRARIAARQARRWERSRSRPTTRAATSSSRSVTTAPASIARSILSKARERGFRCQRPDERSGCLALIFEPASRRRSR